LVHNECPDTENPPPSKLPEGRRDNLPPIPDTATGIPDFGTRIMKWGRFSDSARSRIATLSREYLIENHVTPSIAQAWADFYENIMTLTPDNPSAAGRYDLMMYAVKLLKGN
jgi:hypothetical protein